MTDTLAIALCQIAPVVGDIDGNIARILKARAEAAEKGADLAVFCELVVAGYPPEDLVLKPSCQRASMHAVERLAAETADGGPAMIVGAPWKEGEGLYNGAFLLADGKIAAKRFKVRLPNYGVFDEPRVFASAEHYPDPTEFKGVKLGLMICEDMWLPGAGEHLAAEGAEIFIVPHGSPFRKTALEERTMAARARVAARVGVTRVHIVEPGPHDSRIEQSGLFGPVRP